MLIAYHRLALGKKVIVMNRIRTLGVSMAGVIALVQVTGSAGAVLAQSNAKSVEDSVSVMSVKLSLAPTSAVARYADPQTGLTVDEAVVYALEHNGELLAARKENDATRALVKQAAFQANPKGDARVSKT